MPLQPTILNTLASPMTTDILARKRVWKDRDPEREEKALARARRILASRPWKLPRANPAQRALTQEEQFRLTMMLGPLSDD